jgi:hypothetical protein
MKRVWIGLAVVLAVLVVGLVLVGTLLAREGEATFQKSQKQLADDWARWASVIEADDARWKNHPLLQPRDGGDASPLLFAHVRWDKVDGGRTSPEIPEPLSKQFKEWGADWPKHAGEAGVELLDLAWMSELDHYGYWDLEPVGGPLDAVAFSPLTEPIPQFVDVLDIARARLAQGLASGHHVEAAHEVRELARLSLSTEQLVGAMVTVALLHLEQRAWDEAVDRHLDVSGWEPVSEVDRQRLKRVLWAVNAPLALAGNGPMLSSKLEVGRCTALRQGLGTAHFLRGYLQRRLPERYGALTRSMEESSCRLRRQRAVWTDARPEGQLPVSVMAFCAGEFGDPSMSLCRAPNFVVTLPFVREYLGMTLVASSTYDWFKPYRSP